MKLIRASWDEPLLAKRVFEITALKRTCASDLGASLKLFPKQSLVYIKIPTSCIELNNFIFSLNTKFLETQLSIRKKIEKDVNFNKQSKLLADIAYRTSNDDEILIIKQNIRSGMFDMDRVSSDPAFGEDVGARRYLNWLDSILSDEKSMCFSILNKSQTVVGFFTISVVQNQITAPLGGIFKEYQNKGISHCIVHFPLQYGIENNYKYLSTKISLVNDLVLKIYHRLYSFEIVSSHNVFKLEL